MRRSTCRPFAVLLCIALVACGWEERAPITPSVVPRVSPPPSVRAAAIAILSGNNQQGKAGEQLDEPFVLQVTDANGDGLPRVSVTLTVTTGGGAFGWDANGAVTTSVVRTEDDGVARALFIPLALGTSTVAAVVEGRQDLSVALSAHTASQVVYFVLWGLARFAQDDVTVPVGTLVEWKQIYSRSQYTVTSIAAPPRGMSFDSGILDAEERFEFVPRVAGTWEYIDQLSGARGILTAR